MKNKLCGFVTSLALLFTVTTALPAQAAESTAITSGQTISESGAYYLDSDITGQIRIEGTDLSVALDLNGHSITNSKAAIVNMGTLTLTGSGSVEGQTYYDSADDETYSYNGIWNSGTLTLDANCTASITGAWAAIGNYGGTVTVNNAGTITGGDDWDLYNSGTATIGGGTYNSAGVFNETDGDIDAILTITGGTFNSIISNNGTAMYISGGTFNGQVASPTTVTGGTFSGALYNWLSAANAWNGGVSPDAVVFTSNCKTTTENKKNNKGYKELLAAYSFVANGDNYKLQSVDLVTLTIAVPDSTKGTITKIIIDNDYIANGGAITANKSKTVTQNSAFSLSLTAAAKPGYQFKGWYTDEDGTALLADDATTAEYTNSAMTISADTTIYAIFEVDEELAAAEKFFKDYSTTTEYTISSCEEMRYLAHAVNDLGYDFSGKTVTLSADLDFSDETYIPVGNASHAFAGTFDGGNKTISNITLDSTESVTYQYCGVFGKSTGTIKNLNVKNCTFVPKADNGYTGGGGIAAYSSGTVTDCTADTITLGGWFCGGIVGVGYGMTISNVTAENITFSGGSKRGGIIGYAEALTLSNATIGTITDNVTTGNCGSVVGHLNYGTHNITKVISTSNTDLAAFATLYEQTNPKTVNISDSTISASTIVNELSGATVNIISGNYTGSARVNEDTSGNSSHSAIIITGGTFSSEAVGDVKMYAGADNTTVNDDGTAVVTQDVGVTASDITIKISDTDAYIDEEGNGNIRYITTLNTTNAGAGAVSYYGTWFIPSDISETGTKLEIKTEDTLTTIARYNADLMGIPASELDRNIVGISFIKLADNDNVTTSASLTESVNDIISKSGSVEE